MARKALRGQSRELADRSPRMTFRALEHGVRSQQWKPIIVLLDLLRLNFPAFDRVTLVAIRSKLAPVQIRVAVRAARACFLEYKACMALGAVYLYVHSAQGVGSAVVVEFGDAADRFPAGVGVAVFAGDVDGSVRISARCLFYLALGGSGRYRGKTDEQKHESHELRHN